MAQYGAQESGILDASCPTLGVQFYLLLTWAAARKCRRSEQFVLSVTLGKFHTSKGDVGGRGNPVVGFSPAGKEESW